MANSRLRAMMGLGENNNTSSRIQELYRESNSEEIEIIERQNRKKRLLEKIQEIKNGESELQEKVLEYEAKIEQYNLEKEQIKVKLEVVNETKKQIVKIQKKMKDATGLGYVDMAGGGVAVSFMKHKALDDAQSLIDELISMLDKLGEWAECIEGYKELKVNVDGKSRAYDGFIDTLGVDFVMQREIDKSVRRVDKLKENIADAYGKALREQIEKSKQIEECDKEMEKLLL